MVMGSGSIFCHPGSSLKPSIWIDSVKRVNRIGSWALMMFAETKRIKITPTIADLDITLFFLPTHQNALCLGLMRV
jgi:hypothetical protein